MADDVLVHQKDGSGNIVAVSSSAPLETTAATTASGTVSTVNSSTATLGGAAVFTGTSEEVKDHSIITVMVDSDVDGTLAMQFSTDGTNWDRAKTVVVDQEIGSGSVHTLEVISQYFRIVYTNGAGAQGHFRLQTIYHGFKSGFLTSSPDQVISKINDAQITRVSNDAMFDISRSLYADKFGLHRFGYNGTVPNGSFDDVWSYGPTVGTYPWPTTAETIRVKSGGNAADTSDGAGARTVIVDFLNATGVQVQETLTLAGASASSATSSTCTRVIRAWVATAGTVLSNNTAGILIENTSANQILAAIDTGVGQTEMTMYTIPLGYTGYLTRIHADVSIGTNKDADIRMWQRRDALTFAAPFGAKRLVRRWTAIQGESVDDFDIYQVFPALTDIWVEAQGNGATTEVDIDYDMIMVKDESPTTPQ